MVVSEKKNCHKRILWQCHNCHKTATKKILWQSKKQSLKDINKENKVKLPQLPQKTLTSKKMQLGSKKQKVTRLIRLIVIPPRARGVAVVAVRPKTEKKMIEKTIETKFRNAVKKIGGLALKFHSPFFTGMPDRFVLLPGGRIKFVELKATGKKPSPRQSLVHGMLRSMGFEVWVIDSISGVDDFIKSVKL